MIWLQNEQFLKCEPDQTSVSQNAHFPKSAFDKRALPRTQNEDTPKRQNTKTCAKMCTIFFFLFKGLFPKQYVVYLPRRNLFTLNLTSSTPFRGFGDRDSAPIAPIGCKWKLRFSIYLFYTGWLSMKFYQKIRIRL